jgi:Mg2+ and Co2+ transporter CorA
MMCAHLLTEVFNYLRCSEMLTRIIGRRSHFLSVPQTAEPSPHSAEPSPHPDFPADKLGEFLSSKITSTLDSFSGMWRGTSKGDDHWEGLQDLRSDSDRLRKEIALIRGYLYKLEASKTTLQGTKQLGPLHIRRMLDQSHYFMLTSTRTRDKDQVVLRAARRPLSAAVSENSSVASSDQENFEEVNEPPYSSQEKYPLLMVDQLWLWVIGDTVVTSFPQKWACDGQEDRQQEGDVLDELLHYLRTNKRRPLIREPQDLVNVIISQCAGVFNRPRAKLGLPLHDHFESSVGRVADQEMKLFRRFESASKIDPTIPEQKDEERKRLDKLFDIHNEVKLLDETKDIRDELRMILRVVNDQALVMTDMASVLKPVDGQADMVSPPASPQKGQLDQSSLHMVTQTVTEGAAEGPIRSETISIAYKNRHPIIDANIRDFDRMLAHANASYEALNHLLDLKQKHANATEARFTRKGAEETARQGNTIMFFTIVTIIFGSSSFVTAFFALNITAFPKDANHATSWHLGEITGIVAGISIGLAIPFIVIAFNINRLLALRNIHKRRPGYSSSIAQWKGVFTNIITFQRLRNALWVQKMKKAFRTGKKEEAESHDEKEQMDEKGSTTPGHPYQGPSGMAASQSVGVDQASHEVVYSPTAGTQE